MAIILSFILSEQNSCDTSRLSRIHLLKAQKTTSPRGPSLFVWAQPKSADFEWIWHHLVALTLHGLAPPPTCQIDRLLVELAVCNLLFHAPLLVLRPRTGWLMGGRGSQRGHHLLATQSLSLTLLRHLQPELVINPEVARTHISVSDDSVWMEKEYFFEKKKKNSN